MIRYYGLIKKSSKYAVLKKRQKVYVCNIVITLLTVFIIHYLLEVIKLILILNCIALVERLRSCYFMA
jgi:hypothetical protein